MGNSISAGDKCPWLGLLKDPYTSFAHPSPDHHCFKVYPAGSVDLQYQGDVCLTGSYSACQVYGQLVPVDALPEGLRGDPLPRTKNREPLKWASAILVIAVSILAVWFALDRFARLSFSPLTQSSLGLTPIAKGLP